MSKVKQDRKASITIHFGTPAAAVEWFNQMLEAGVFGEEQDAGLFQIDMLDQGQITSANEFIVRRAGSRGDQEVTLKTTTEIVVSSSGSSSDSEAG